MYRPDITDAEVLTVTNGVDESTDQSIVCLTMRLGSDWSPFNYSLSVQNARSLLSRLHSALTDELPVSPESPCCR
jgi:hypothetical protein